MSTPIVCPFRSAQVLIDGSIEPTSQSTTSMPSMPTRSAPLAIDASAVGVGAHAASICPAWTARSASVPVVNCLIVTFPQYFE